MEAGCPASAAFFIPAPTLGGAELNTVRLATGFSELGIETDLVAARLDGPLAARLPPAIHSVDLRARTPVALTKTAALARYLAARRPEILISALDIVNTALWARWLARVPTRIVLTVRTHLSQQFGDKPDRGVAELRRALVRWSYPKVDGVVAVSRGVADDLLRMAPVSEDRLRVIYNPVFTPDLPRRAAEPVADPWLSEPGPPVIVGSGRLVRQKDFGTLIDAFAVLRARRAARLIILGDEDPREPGQREQLLGLARRRGVAEDIRLPGAVQNPHAYVARAAVFALSSIYEGFGNVVAEALAVGTPVVSTDAPSGPSEILDGGAFGHLVPVGDSAALADALERTLDSPPPKETLRERAELFRQERIVEEYLRLWRSLQAQRCLTPTAA